jgi:hypothetical protein
MPAFVETRKIGLHGLGQVMTIPLKKGPTHPNSKVEAEPPAGCFHSPIKVSLQRAAKLLTLVFGASDCDPELA